MSAQTGPTNLLELWQIGPYSCNKKNSTAHIQKEEKSFHDHTEEPSSLLKLQQNGLYKELEVFRIYLRFIFN